MCNPQFACAGVCAHVCAEGRAVAAAVTFNPRSQALPPTVARAVASRTRDPRWWVYARFITFPFCPLATRCAASDVTSAVLLKLSTINANGRKKHKTVFTDSSQ